MLQLPTFISPTNSSQSSSLIKLPPLSIHKVVSHVSSRRLGTHRCFLEFQSAKPNPVFGPRTLGGFGNCFSSLGHATGSPGPAIRSPFLIPSLSR